MKISPATINDKKFFWRLRNEKEARRQSTSTRRIPWPDHKKWFVRALTCPRDYRLFRIEQDRRKIGYVRLRRTSGGWSMSVCLEPEVRGLGYGTKAIRRVCSRKEITGPIRAEIKKENVASLKAFSKAGFIKADESDEFVSYVFTKKEEIPMADKVVPGSNVTRGDVPVHRIPGGTQGGIEISPDDLRRPNEGQNAWMAGVNTTPKAPRSDPETADYQVKRPG